ncbi:hypothetical protein [Nannocystis sp.]|uniref:hypothetical protein n=1 Tax=Nannocystis sp. TaxID=1962667 RepID=UPI00242217B9|nr:hypothetical protein [Nannocystis sp.]MBK7824569.1 hypothetical protein [Nannocystis sp.]MBK9753179.1 hypothetical protein [Nannocystis sp.]
MSDAPKSKVPPNAPPDEPQGSLGAVLIGAAILIVAALLIFWPDNDAASDGAGGGKASKAGQQGSNMADGGRSGTARGIQPRAVDPAEARMTPQVRPGLLAPTDGLATMPTPKPEPTSFPSAAAEIAYFEKKLVQAREDLVARTTFLERMKKTLAEGAISEHDRNTQRAKIVQSNYDKAQARVTELEQKVADLKRKQTGG